MTVMRIEGVSMLPYFGEGSVLVVKKINAARLHEGMVVVYTNRFGETVAHRLVARVDGGWQVKGWNNDRADTTVVTATNLLGVVYATFHSSGPASVPALGVANRQRSSCLGCPGEVIGGAKRRILNRMSNFER